MIQPIGDDAAANAWESARSNVRIIVAPDNDASVKGHVIGILHKGIGDFVESPVVVEVIIVNIGDDRQRRREFEGKNRPRLVGFGDQIFPFSESGAGSPNASNRPPTTTVGSRPPV